MSEEAFWAKLKPLAHKLFEFRAKRVRPGRDEKVLTSWNSLMISAFVDGYKLSGQEQFLKAASSAAEFIKAQLLVENDRLLRTWGQGKAKLNAYLDDYAFYVQALLDLASVHGDPNWIDLALRLTESMLSRFTDEEKIGFYFTSDDHESLLARPRSHFDGSLPSGTSVVVFNLLRLSKLTDNQEYRKRAEKILHHYQPAFASMPDQFAHLIEAMDFACAKSIEIVLVQSGESEGARELLLEIHRHYLPNKVVIVKDTALKLEGKTKRTDSPEIALLRERDLVKGSPAVYVCENFACDEPITTVAALSQKMKSLSQTLKLTILPKRE
jgi:uncharacterized protein YyaL (SSP411 family)